MPVALLGGLAGCCYLVFCSGRGDGQEAEDQAAIESSSNSLRNSWLELDNSVVSRRIPRRVSFVRHAEHSAPDQDIGHAGHPRTAKDVLPFRGRARVDVRRAGSARLRGLASSHAGSQGGGMGNEEQRRARGHAEGRGCPCRGPQRRQGTHTLAQVGRMMGDTGRPPGKRLETVPQVTRAHRESYASPAPHLQARSPLVKREG